MSTYRELLIGCGRRRDKRMWLPPADPTQGAGDASNRQWRNLYTLDFNPRCDPDIICDLSCHWWFAKPRSLNFQFQAWCTARGLTCIDSNDGQKLRSDYFDEIHAYEVLEHLGELGDEIAFFAHFSEIWRILKPNGFLLATCPSRFSKWLWGDPSHKRAITPETLIFLDQRQYKTQCDDESTRTPMSDFRELYEADFNIVYSHDNKETHSFILQAVKPSRITL